MWVFHLYEENSILFFILKGIHSSCFCFMELGRWKMKKLLPQPSIFGVMLLRFVTIGNLCRKVNNWAVKVFYATCSWSYVHSHFLCKNLNAVCDDYLIIFRYLLTFFFALFFQKQVSKDHITQGNLLKTTLMFWDVIKM